MSGEIDIISIGMVSAVGLDAPSACAAMRARVDGFRETRFKTGQDEWLIGAPIPWPQNWIGEKRLAHIAASAVEEAFAGAPGARGQTATIICLAEDDRLGHPTPDGARLLKRIADLVDIAPHGRARIVSHGRPSGLVALEQARRLISGGDARYVLIIGVDSYLTAPTVAHYQASDRLLTKENPNGFIPGEAAAAVICARPGDASTLRLFGLGFAREPAAIYNADDLPFRGDGMTAAYRSALEETGIEMNKVGYRISDLIGEQYFFKQSALASIRLLRGRHEFQDIWSPAESLGNIGAAAGPMMIAMAWTAAAKGYAAGNPVLIEASNDAGACGAALLGRMVRR